MKGLIRVTFVYRFLISICAEDVAQSTNSVDIHVSCIRFNRLMQNAHFHIDLIYLPDIVSG